MNIFEEFLAATPNDGEPVEGVFQCSETGCFDIVEEAVYHPSNKTTTWTCMNGHNNTEKDFNIG